MQIIRQAANFEALHVTRRCARVMPEGTVRVYERNDDNDTLREYTVPLATVTEPRILRAARKEHFQEYIDIPATGTI